jgi:hypothetical protein
MEVGKNDCELARVKAYLNQPLRPVTTVPVLSNSLGDIDRSRPDQQCGSSDLILVQE